MRPPFTPGGIVLPPYFIGREREVERLAHSLGTLSEHIVVVGQRRMGKSSLLVNACKLIEIEHPHVQTVYVDCRRITDAFSFLDVITHAVLEAHRRHRGISGWLRLKSRLLKESLLDTLPQVQRIGGSVGKVFSAYVEFREKRIEPTTLVENAFDFLAGFSDERDTSHVVVLDEFQELAKLRMPEIFQAFKTHADRLQRVRFAFSGSSLSVLEKVFLEPESPLYLMASRLRLEPLDEHTVAGFVKKRLSTAGVEATQEAARTFHPLTGGVPYYVQRLGTMVWMAALVEGEDRVDDKLVKRSFNRLLLDLSSEFETRWEHRFGPQQRAIIMALAGSGPLSRKQIAQESGRATTQLSMALTTLEGAMEIQQKARGVYMLRDRVFAAWLRSKA